MDRDRGRPNVEIKLEDDGTRLEIETAVHVGLIVNDLLTNQIRADLEITSEKEKGTTIVLRYMNNLA